MTKAQRVKDCPSDAERLAPLRPSLQDGVDGAGDSDYRRDDPRQKEWPHNIISLRATAYACGVIARDGEAVEHDHDPKELQLCRRLAEQAAAQLHGVRCFGGEAREGYLPFFVTANADRPVPAEISAEVVRQAFGGTIYPETPIALEPLVEGRDFWTKLCDVYHLEKPDGSEGSLAVWLRAIRWFAAQQELSGACYVTIGYDAGQEPNLAAVFPRLAVALTKAGSLVGVCGCISQA